MTAKFRQTPPQWLGFLMLALVANIPVQLLAERPTVSQMVLTGTVIDHGTSLPIAGAVVELIRNNQTVVGATTEKDGSFEIRHLPPGNSRIEVSLLGYHGYSHNLSITGGISHKLVISLVSDPIQLAPVEIVGESPTINRKHGGTVARLKPEVVALIKPVGTQELLELVPGINGYADDGFGNSRLSIGIRGLNPRRSSRVLILEDGVPIQPAVYVYPNAYYNPPPERIEAMEVIKGSSAIRFGPQTMGGVINYTTRRPGGPGGFGSQFTVGNNNYYSGFWEWRSAFSDRATSDVQLLYKHGDGFRENNTFDQVNGTFKSQYRINTKKVLYLKANTNFENTNATYTGLTEYSFRTDPMFNPKEDDTFRILRTSLDLIYTSRITAGLMGNTTVYMSYFDRRWWREDDVFIRASALGSDNPEPVPYFQSGDLVRVGGGSSNFGVLRTFYVGGIAQDYSLAHSLAGQPALGEAGIRVHWERFIDDKKIGNTPDARSGVYFTGTPDNPNDPVKIVGQSHHYETSALSLYAKERIEHGRLTLSPGLRFEIFEQERIDRLRGSVLADKVSSILLPGLGANYAFEWFNLFAGIHRGYTPPSSSALKVTNFGEDADTGGLDLQAEKSWNMEAGFRSWGQNLSIEATVFLLKIENLVAAGRGTAFKNLGKVDTRGIELSTVLATSHKWTILPDINLSYTLLGTEIKSGVVRSTTKAGTDVDLAGNKLPYAPTHTLTVGLTKQMTPALRLRAALRFVGKVYTDFENIERTFNRGDTGSIPCYSILNSGLDYRVNNRWSAFVTGKNIRDEIYIGSRLHSNAGQPEANLSSGILIGPRRQVNIGFKRHI